MAFPRKLRELCTPAFIYFIISMIGIVGSILQNIGNRNRYSLGSFSTRVPSTTLVFVVKLIYIFFWTWILNLMCKDGHKEIAWFLVLIPFILLFVVMGLVMVDPMMEGFSGPPLTAEEGEKAKNAGWMPPNPTTNNSAMGGSVPAMGGSVPAMGGSVPAMGGSVPAMGRSTPTIPLGGNNNVAGMPQKMSQNQYEVIPPPIYPDTLQ